MNITLNTDISYSVFMIIYCTGTFVIADEVDKISLARLVRPYIKAVTDDNICMNL